MYSKLYNILTLCTIIILVVKLTRAIISEIIDSPERYQLLYTIMKIYYTLRPFHSCLFFIILFYCLLSKTSLRQLLIYLRKPINPLNLVTIGQLVRGHFIIPTATIPTAIIPTPTIPTAIIPTATIPTAIIPTPIIWDSGWQSRVA